MVDFETFPNKSGLYYFYENDRLLYIGKAKNLKSRIREHFKANESAVKYIEFIRNNDVTTILGNKQLFLLAIDCLNGQRIDLVCNRITKIEIDVLPHKELKELEKSKILQYRPPFNHETIQKDSIDDVLEKLSYVRRQYVKNSW